GFNLMAHRPTWQTLPTDIKTVIENHATRYVRQQRQEQAALNARLRDEFQKRGLVFNDVDQAAFRAKLPRVYATWKEKLGIKCWSLREAEAGRLGLKPPRGRRDPLRLK